MQIKLNHQIKILPEQFTVQQLIDVVVSNKSGIALAVNNVVVLKNNWLNHELQENDDVLIIKATQGG
jgi:sulfur carrier protein